jgi:hypothetical protein
MSAVAAPKTFQQLRNFLIGGAGVYGYWTGVTERVLNANRWQQHQLAQWSENAAKARAAQPASTGEVPEIIPAELHETYKALSSH